MSACRTVICALGLVLALVAGVVTACAFWYRLPGDPLLHKIAIAIWILYLGATFRLVFTPYRKAAWGVFLVVMAGVVLWWSSIYPRLDRDCAPDVAHIATGTVKNGHIVTLHNVRDFHWRTPKDYDARWETRTYDLDQITGVDLLLTYWGMPAIAHTMISFGFKNGDHVVFSVEIRKEKGEVYSNIAGFFKQYELALIAGDERDMIYYRTNVTGQDMYRYKLHTEPGNAKKLFLSYLEEGRRISTIPAFYNTITANCTTIVFHMARALSPGKLHLDPRVILSGYLPGYLRANNPDYQKIDEQTMRANARITDKAMAAGYSKDFSRLIRE